MSELQCALLLETRHGPYREEFCVVCCSCPQSYPSLLLSGCIQYRAQLNAVNKRFQPMGSSCRQLSTVPLGYLIPLGARWINLISKTKYHSGPQRPTLHFWFLNDKWQMPLREMVVVPKTQPTNMNFSMNPSWWLLGHKLSPFLQVQM